MVSRTKKLRKPAITISQSDYDKLSQLAESLSSSNEELADQLFGELDRARVVDDPRLPVSVIRIGSALRFKSDIGESRDVTLVLPGEADIANQKISVLSPVGIALIGLKAGHSMSWITPNGQSHQLTIEAVGALVKSDASREPEGELTE